MERKIVNAFESEVDHVTALKSFLEKYPWKRDRFRDELLISQMQNDIRLSGEGHFRNYLAESNTLPTSQMHIGELESDRGVVQVYPCESKFGEKETFLPLQNIFEINSVAESNDFQSECINIVQPQTDLFQTNVQQRESLEMLQWYPWRSTSRNDNVFDLSVDVNFNNTNPEMDRVTEQNGIFRRDVMDRVQHGTDQFHSFAQQQESPEMLLQWYPWKRSRDELLNLWMPNNLPQKNIEREIAEEISFRRGLMNEAHPQIGQFHNFLQKQESFEVMQFYPTEEISVSSQEFIDFRGDSVNEVQTQPIPFHAFLQQQEPSETVQLFPCRKRFRETSPESAIPNKRLRLLNNFSEMEAKLNKKNTERKGRPISMGDQDPVNLLHELFPDQNFKFSYKLVKGRQKNSLFNVRCKVKNSYFEGKGRSKKLARIALAKAALSSFGVSCSPMARLQNGTSNSECKKISSLELSQIYADKIGTLVQQKFKEVVKGRNLYGKVLSGIVMTKNMKFDEAKVLCVSSGTKCLSGEHINANGTVLNDCHAEIVSRRCFMYFLYAELKKHLNPLTANQSILEKNQNNRKYPYKLKNGLQIHLYISTVPCGDAAIFNLHERCINESSNVYRGGQLRNKIEAKQGTIPVSSFDGIQTWDGILRGESLRTMSCSDKIARWNVLGIQGALLASLIEPIYLHSIVLGSLLHPKPMYRAVCGRIEKTIQNLPSPYILNKPLLAMITSIESRDLTVPPKFSINWTINNRIEVVDSITGKTNQEQMSRLSKKNLFQKYLNLVRTLPNTNLLKRNIASDYRKAKNAVQDYQMAKNHLYEAFRKADLGNWLKKPIEQDEFSLK